MCEQAVFHFALSDLSLTCIHGLSFAQSAKALLPVHDRPLSCTGYDQHAPQDLLLEARCCLASWLCTAEGILGPENFWQARQV